VADRLNEDQRKQLRDAMQKIADRPAIQEARKALESAAAEGRREAFQKLRRATFAAIAEINPELAKVLEKLRPEGQPPGGPGARRGPGEGGSDQPPPKDQPPPRRNPSDGPPPPGAPEDAPPKNA
jgi:mRNA-degrading endonuclease RelE of RelBE toxin-antitoxin system